MPTRPFRPPPRPRPTNPTNPAQVSYEVVGGSEVLPGEAVTVAVSLEREADGDEVGPVPAPHFPGRRDEGWWLVVGDTKVRRRLGPLG